MSDSFFEGLPEREASAFHSFAGGELDRRGEARGADAVAAAIADEAARAYLFAGDKVVLKTRSDPVFTIAEALAVGGEGLGEPTLLGWHNSAPRLAYTLPEAEASAGLIETGLRALASEGAVPPEHVGALALARSLAEWHRRHRFCANCGQPTQSTPGGFRRDCAACAAEHFPRVDPVAIMLAVSGDRCLLGRGHVEGPWSCLAGFIEAGETIENAVRREIHEESGIMIGRVRYHSSQPWPFPSQLMIGFHAEATSTAIARDDHELADCRWFDRAEVSAMLAGAHPDGLSIPPPVAIAHHLIADWVHAE